MYKIGIEKMCVVAIDVYLRKEREGYSEIYFTKVNYLFFCAGFLFAKLVR